MGSTAERRQRAKLERLKRKVEAESPLMEFSFRPADLLHIGPVIQTDLGITQSHEDALRAAGLPVPPKVRCKFLGSLQTSQVIDGLIGRTLLERFELKYNGRTGKVTMRYLRT